MGIGYNLLGANLGNKPLIHIQEEEPSLCEGLWVRTDYEPSSIKSLLKSEYMKGYSLSWEARTIPLGYNTFAIVNDDIYLIGKADSTYAKASLLTYPYEFSIHNSGDSSLFTSTAVIGNKIYAVKDGSSLLIYEMDTSVDFSEFQISLPEVSGFNNPRICSYNNKIYALRGATSGTQLVMSIDTSDIEPVWTAHASLSEDTSKSAIIALNGYLYAIGIMSTGYKNYGLDLNNSSATWQIVTGFASQGTYFPSLSDMGGILRIINCGYSVAERNCLSLINGVWRSATQTGITPLSNNFTSNGRAYHTEYGLYAKDRINDILYVLKRINPITDLPHNTLMLVKGDNGIAINTSADVQKYSIRESIIAAYRVIVEDEKEEHIKLPIYYYNEGWIKIDSEI